MTPHNGFDLVGWVRTTLVALLWIPCVCAADSPPARALAAKEAVAPAAPPLPAEVVASMQQGRYAEAEAALDRLTAQAKTDADRAYLALVRGIAQRLDHRADAARRTLGDALKAAPKGTWAAKIRYELATLELAAGRLADAEALARELAEALLDGDRKDRLAEVDHAFARTLLKPDDPITKPDPNAAYDLLSQARGLAKGEPLRAALLYAMARASQAAANHGRAIQDFQTYLKEYPKGSDRTAARYHLGEAEADAGQPLVARRTWTDLARNLGQAGADKPLAKEDDSFRARALYRIAATYGIPNPPDDTSLNLGVAALHRFLQAYPAHPWAVKAAHEIGAAYLARGQSQPALEALNAFLKGGEFRAESDEAKRDLAQLSMTAAFQVGQVLQAQEKFAEAIAAWKGYLAQYPNGPQSADALRAILDTELRIADDHLRREQFAEARAAWQAFVAQNPLDGRVPQILFQIGASFTTREKKFDQAIAAWETLLSKFPATEPAAHAQFAIAALFEEEKGDPATAIARFQKIAVEPWKSQGAQRVAVMESKALSVVTPRAFRSGETAHLKITTRNLEKLTFTAYRLNAEAYFRKKHALRDVEALDISLVRPDAEWTVEVPGYARYKPIETTYDLKKVAVPGVYVVKVTDEKTLQATTLVVGSDLDAIVKTSREQVLIFAQDMKTGRGRAGARVLVADDEGVILDARTGKDGVLVRDWEKPLAPPPGANAAPNGEVPLPPGPPPAPVPCTEPVADAPGAAADAPAADAAADHPRLPKGSFSYLVLDGADVAGSGLGVPEKVAQGLSPRAYLSTDRPAYRPGQRVALRGVVREVKDGQYANVPGAVYKLEVSDSRGRQIVARPVTLSAFGTFHESIPLDAAAPVGTYRVRVYQPGKSDFAGQFEVQAYQLEKIDLSFDLKKTVYFRGETVEADLIARYPYGAPVANRPIAVLLPDNRVERGMTDGSGKYHVSFSTEGFADEQALRLAAQLPQDNVATVARVMLAVRAFSISLQTTRDVYLEGESFLLRASTFDAQGEPTGQTLSVSVLKRVTQAGRTAEREVARQEVTTDPKTGRGSVALKVEDEQGGSFVVRVAGTDRFGNPVVADRELTISGKKDETTLRILADRQTYKVGEEASVNLHSRGRAGTALLAWEADRILQYRLVTLTEGDNRIGWAIEHAQFPNFTLTACRMSGTHFDEASLDVRVERDLRVTLTPKKPSLGPGEAVEVEVATVDQRGRPVAAEVAVALIDRALLRRFEDRQPAIGPFFYDQTRTGAFATVATNTFKYEPATSDVSGAVVEENERAVAQAANAADRSGLMVQAKRQAVALGAQGIPINGVPVPAAAETPPPPEYAGMSLPSGKYMNDAVNAPAPVRAGVDGRSLVEEDMKREGQIALGEANGDFALFSGDITSRDAAEKQSDRKGGAVRLGRNLAYFGFQGGQAGRPAGGAAPPRERFVETAYWNPSVVTDKEGKATITFHAPMALAEYRFSARGVTGADTLVGQTTAALVVRKDFFVDLKVPATLTQGDRPRFIAQVHHVGVTGQVAVKLVLYAAGRETVEPRTIDLKADGIDEVSFEPFEVPDGDVVRLTLTAAVGAATDELVTEVPIRPWGVPAFASASGTASDDATVFVGLPPGRTYESPEMLILLSPTLRRMLIELALGQDAYPMVRNLLSCSILPTNTMADRAGDLLAATQAMEYLRATKATAAPEASRLTGRIQGLVSELTAAQNEDGGWPWVAGPRDAPNQARPSDRATTARVVWALASAEPLGLLTDPKALDKSAAYLTQELAKVGGPDHDTRALLLHALSTRHKATFEQVNSLNRLRQGLSDAALAYLALTLANLDRASLADEVLGLLVPRAKTESAGAGQRARRYWEGQSPLPFNRGAVEATGLAALAFAKVRPQASELPGAVDWLLAHRQGTGWLPHKASGPVLAALAGYYGRAQGAEDRYRLVVSVNDAEVARLDVTGAAEGRALVVPRKALKAGDRNRVRFAIEGRGTFGYAVTMTGFTRDFTPDQNRANRSALINRRDYRPAPPELDGKVLPTGFGVVTNPTYFYNKASRVALGGKVRVELNAYRNEPGNRPEWERDFLVVEEYLPAGTTLIEGSVHSAASSYTLADNVLTFYFAPGQGPGDFSYEVYGYLPGHYRALPTSIRSAYEPGRMHLGLAGDLRVLAPGEPNTDPYRPTPDELYARGKAQFDAGRLAEAATPLEALFTAYTLREDIAKDAARMLLLINIHERNPRKIVQYFEVVKEKAPELVLSFDQLRAIGTAYTEINEYERAYLVWRGVIEASYLEDAHVGEVLRQRGKTLEAIAYLIGLWREYPDTASIESDFFGLSQVLAQHAGQAITDPALRRALADAGVTRSALLLQAIRLIQTFLALSPKNPMADEASLALVGSFLELEDFESVVKLAARFATLYPKSTFLDSFQYSEVLGEFHLGHHDRAIAVAETIAKATYQDPNGVEQPSPNKWQALYILGQIYDARRQPSKALSYYEQVAERFSDAAGAVKSLTRKALTLPEVTVVRSASKPVAAAEGGGGGGFRAVAPADDPAAKTKPGVALDYRNIAEVDVKVYPVDLMRLYLTRRTLAGIAGIDLAGITPLLERTIALGAGEDFAEKVRTLDLALDQEGAYLVMVRGGDRYASGIVLVTPLSLEVLEESDSGRVRVTVREAATEALVPKVQVKVIGTHNGQFVSGETDLRGVFVAEGITGQVTAVARQGAARYAFYRGTTTIGPPPAQPQAADATKGAPQAAENATPGLDVNLKNLNNSNQFRQIERLQNRYNPTNPGGAEVRDFK